MTIQYQFEVLNRDDEGYQARIRLTPTQTDVPVDVGELKFSFMWRFKQEHLTNADLVERSGDFHRLAINQTINEPFDILIDAKGPKLPKIVDWPYGVYFTDSKGVGHDVIDVSEPLDYGNPLKDASVDVKKGQYPVVPQPNDMKVSEKISKVAGELMLVINEDISHAGAGFTTVMGSICKQYKLSKTGASIYASINSDLSCDYQLKVLEQSIELVGVDEAGLHAGFATLAQTLHFAERSGELRQLVVEDSAAFEYRGLHLDCVRHFFDHKTIEDVLVYCYLYKLNKFHWHFTDDEGWRIEIKKYPELTRESAWRGPEQALPPQMGTGLNKYGGFYTQEQVKGVLDLADSMGVEVIPEIDLPGHARAFLYALGDQVKEAEDKSEYLSVQLYSDNVINPGYGNTMQIVYDVLDEICDLFPSKIIHIGSDEVPKGVWTQSPAASAFMEEKGLKTPEELHGWFLRDVEKYVNTKGKHLAGWEEVTTNEDVSNDTLVYSWQGTEAGLTAASLGHPVVMTPAQYCYLDISYNMDLKEPGYYWSGVTDLQKAYSYDPIPEKATSLQQQKIVGVQACVWSEVIDTDSKLQFMMFPKVVATAETGWTKSVNKNWLRFEQSAKAHAQIWQSLNIHYRPLALEW